MIQLDRQIFYWINFRLTAPWLDRLFIWWTDADHFYPFLIAILLLVLIFGSKKWKASVLFAVIAVVLSDLILYHILKPLLHRHRPFMDMDNVRLLVQAAKNSWSMPSNHAGNTAAAAVILGIRHRKWIVPGIIIAFLSGYSRIYVGVHYPSDVVVGWICGTAVALFVFFAHRYMPQSIIAFWKSIQKKFLQRNKDKKTRSDVS